MTTTAFDLRAGPAVMRADSVARVALPGARDDRLYFAQVREDAALELDALSAMPRDTIVAVSSGGCTALSLLAAGAGRVIGVDVNRAQNHLVELKFAAVRLLPNREALSFLGAAPGNGLARRAAYERLRTQLSAQAQQYWDTHWRSLERGVLDAGATEQFIRLIVAALRATVHSRRRIERLLACQTIAEQEEVFRTEWNSRRWRAFFDVLLNRAVMQRAYDPAFFAHVGESSFAAHFRARANYTIARLSIANNYFLHHMLTGRYPADRPGGLPLYLDPFTRGRLAGAVSALSLVDGTMTEYLRTLGPGSVSGFALSNICEWLTSEQVDELFAEVLRVSRPGATVCFRNFVGWTEVPAGFRHVIVEDRARGEALMQRDRSVVQRRFAICRVTAGGSS